LKFCAKQARLHYLRWRGNFDPVRAPTPICRGKETAEEWLDVHRTWHRRVAAAPAPWLYGHIERWPTASNHCVSCANLQDETGGFYGLPIAFEPQKYGPLTHQRTARRCAPSHLAVSDLSRSHRPLTRIAVSLGLTLAKVSLSYGGDI